VNTPDDKNWKSVFSVILEEYEGEVGGRTSAIPDELRQKLERMAKGEFNEETVQKLCEEIADSTEALQALARLLKEHGNDQNSAVNS
jgi:hypothetical protein